jgi:hypothetical protein
MCTVSARAVTLPFLWLCPPDRSGTAHAGGPQKCSTCLLLPILRQQPISPALSLRLLPSLCAPNCLGCYQNPASSSTVPRLNPSVAVCQRRSTDTCPFPVLVGLGRYDSYCRPLLVFLPLWHPSVSLRFPYRHSQAEKRKQVAERAARPGPKKKTDHPSSTVQHAKAHEPNRTPMA